MIDVVSRRCQHPQCVRRPLYAMPGQRAMFCRTHKDPGHTDVVSRRCNFEVSAQLNTFCCWTLLNAAPPHGVCTSWLPVFVCRVSARRRVFCAFWNCDGQVCM